MRAKSKLCYIKDLSVFSRLQDEEYKIIDRCTSIREIRKGETLYYQDTKDNNIYILIKGVIKITKLLPSGKETILDIVKGGAILGEMVFIGLLEKDESAQVMEDGLLCIIRQADFEHLLTTVPGLAPRMAKIIGPGVRRRKVEGKLLDFLYSSIEQRLAKTLLSLLEDFGLPHNNGYLIKIKLSHRDYADLVASTRETVTATLSKLKRDGIIDFEERYVVVKSVDKLRAAAVGE